MDTSSYVTRPPRSKMSCGAAVLKAILRTYSTSLLTAAILFSTPLVATAQLPVVSIAATDANASEPGANEGSFTVTRGGSTTSPLTVTYTANGSTAALGGDYGVSPAAGSVTIPIGSLTASITITPINDTEFEGPETVIFTLLASATYTIGGASATVNIADDDLPTVTIAATDAAAAEPNATGTFTVTRSGNTGAALAVSYAVSGSASPGDYTTSPAVGSVTIPAGAASATITITPVNDSEFEGAETVIFTISANAAYAIGSPASATVNIADNDLPTVTITATDASAGEGGNTGTFTVSRTGTTASALTVTYTAGGTAEAADYATSPSVGSVTISSGASTATITITPVDDAAVEGAETVIFTVVTNASHVAGSPASATVNIADNDVLPTVTISATDANASEAGGNTGTFTVSRTGSTASALTVNYTAGGSASEGDYGVSPAAGSVIIGSGSSSAPITITPVNDSDFEGNETVVFTIAASGAYTIGASSSATVTIADNDLPTVSITATDPDAAEPNNTGTFTVVRTGITSAALTVSYTAGGSASPGDYSTNPSLGSITIPAGSSQANITVTPVNDSEFEETESVVFTISASGSYSIGSPSSDTLTIGDNDLPGVSVTASDPNAAEPDDTGTFTFSRTGPTGASLVVTYSIGGSAGGSDYALTPPPAGTITIPAGSSSAIVTVTPSDDFIVEGNETVVITVLGSSGVAVGSPSSATVTIGENDELPRVSIVINDPSSVDEFATVTAKAVITRTGPTVFPLTVLYSAGGSATPGADYPPLPGSVLVPVGAQSAEIPLAWTNDTVAESNETIQLTITANSAYVVGSPSSAELKIIDNDGLVTITASGAFANENGSAPGLFTVTRSRVTDTPLIVKFTVEGTAGNGADYVTINSPVTIPANTAAAVIQVLAINDALADVSETVTLTLTNAIEYVVGSPSSATVIITDDDTPVISSLNPNVATAGTAAFTLTVLGGDFGDGAVVLWNGDPLTTTFVSRTELRAAVAAQRITTPGTVTISVRSGGTTSNTRDFTISATPVIQSLNPSTVNAGGPAFTLTVTGTGFAAGASVTWNGSPLTTTFVSSTQLTAAISASLIATPQTVNVSTVSQGVSSNSVTLPVLQFISSISPTSTVAPSPALTLTINGSGFANGSAVFWNETALTTTFVNSTRLTASVAASLVATPTTAQITVRFQTFVSNAISFSALPPNLPSVTIVGPPPPSVPTQNAIVQVQLGAASPTALNGTLTLTFNPIAGLPAGYRDPALQFVAGGPTLDFTVPAQATTATLPQNGAIQQGTVAGDIFVTMSRLMSGTVNVLPQPAPSRTITVPRLAPVITPGSVRITNVTTNTFEVDLTAYSTPRDLATATFTFTAAPGTGIEGSPTLSLDIRNAVNQWYASNQSLPFGSMLRIRVGFTLVGNAAALQTVSVTLTNSVGTSTAVSGGR